MTSSENEDFESADEEIEEKTFSVKRENSKEDEHTDKNDTNNVNQLKESNSTSDKPLDEKKKIDCDGWEAEDDWGTSWEHEVENVSSEFKKKSLLSEKPEIIEDKEHDHIEDSEETKIISDLKDEKENTISNARTPTSSGWLGGGWGSSLFNAANSITQTLSQENASNDQTASGFGSLLFGVTKLVEQTSSAVISGGLDTLETIGKKTMEVLQDGDPGLKKKRAVLFSDRPILSQVLRDAKLKAEEEETFQTKNNRLKKNVYEVIFDEEQGLVHLEALEMLSKQSELRIQTKLMSSTGLELKQLQNEMQKIREVVDNYSEQEEQDKDLTNDDALIEASLVIGNSAAVQKFLQRYSELREKGAEVKENVLLETQEVNESENVEEEDDIDEEEKLKRVLQEKANRKTQQEAIRSLAILSAAAMDLFHKSAELILVEPITGDNKQRQKEIIRKTIAFVQISELLGSFLNETAKEFSEILSSSNVSNEIISNLFLDAESSASCIQEALQLCIPILQEHGLF